MSTKPRIVFKVLVGIACAWALTLGTVAVVECRRARNMLGGGSERPGAVPRWCPADDTPARAYLAIRGAANRPAPRST